MQQVDRVTRGNELVSNRERLGFGLTDMSLRFPQFASARQEEDGQTR